ncbi:MAG: hypothetical protein B7Y36_19050 [Novosphingobium sp. 28-62-57]|uniref:hypothetical protein n=1 Tax=Novosphingobium sp. 28-62-57 TaxID=1970409 RepID=UPI000BD9E1D6|nr:hypothetical protein [Novosphingobium sp. 28-62-57]OYZ07654.1 MAG: hypothetical protein B7Y36_19050 [Novosphingobium sp. 28-62-57]OYZ46570.1 MAG: hypothetical protein B7Y31_00715 [Novosphingobium sp. 16-62-11]
MTDTGNAAQTRLIAEQVAKAAVSEFVAEHPELRPPPETPALVKWVVGAVAALGSASIIGSAFWLVGTVNSMRETLTRLDERIQNGAVKDGRYDDLDRRVTALELKREDGHK